MKMLLRKRRTQLHYKRENSEGLEFLLLHYKFLLRKWTRNGLREKGFDDVE